MRKFNDSPQDRHKTDGHNKMNENKVACGIKTGHKSAHDNDSIFKNEMNNFVENCCSSNTGIMMVIIEKGLIIKFGNWSYFE